MDLNFGLDFRGRYLFLRPFSQFLFVVSRQLNIKKSSYRRLMTKNSSSCLDHLDPTKYGRFTK